MDHDKLLQEAVDRCRRIETRLTRYLSSLGFDTGSKHPTWSVVDGEGVVTAPSPAVSVVDCVAAIPLDHDPEHEVRVMYDGRVLGYVLSLGVI